MGKQQPSEHQKGKHSGQIGQPQTTLAHRPATSNVGGQPSRVSAINENHLDRHISNLQSFTSDFKILNANDLNNQTSATGKAHQGPSEQTRFGQRGDAVNIVTNYVAVSSLPSTLYQYDIAFGTVPKPSKPGDPPGAAQQRDVEAKNEKGRVFDALANLSPLRASEWATNLSTLWTLQKLQLDSTGAHDVQNVSFRKPNGQLLQISFVRFENEKSFDLRGRSVSLVGDRKTDGQHPAEAIAALNRIISRHIQANATVPITAIGENKFFMNYGVQRMDMLNATRGYYTSIRPGYHDVFLNINPATAAFYHPQIVTDFLDQAARGRYADPHGLLINRKVRIMYDVKPRDDSTNPNLESNRKRTIAEFGLPCNQQMFDLGDQGDQLISVKDFFETQHHITLRRPEARAVNVQLRPDKDVLAARDKARARNSKRDPALDILNPRATWIPPELLELEPNQIFARRLGSDHVRQMIAHGRRAPALNLHLTQTEALRVMRITANNTQMGNLGMTIDRRLIGLPGRILNAPLIRYKDANDNSRKPLDPSQAASWDLDGADKFFLQPSRTSGVRVIHLERWKDNRLIPSVVWKKLQERISLRIPSHPAETFQERYWQTCSANPDHLAKNLVNAFNALNRPAVVFVILPRQESEPFGAVKRIADRTLGAQTICFTQKKIEGRLNDSTFDSLALKFNMRLRGQNHQVVVESSAPDPSRSAPDPSSGPAPAGDNDGFEVIVNKKGKGKGGNRGQPTQAPQAGPSTGITEVDKYQPAFANISEDTIVMGADVTHPPPGAMLGCPSIAAVVGSTDVNVSNFPGSMRLQNGREEIIADMKEMVIERLRAWQSANDNRTPKRVLFYRDGVSESQYDQVKGRELPAIRAAFKTLKVDDPEIIFIVCGKRHHTRFYPQAQTQSYGKTSKGVFKWNGNVKPGLVVDKVITRPPANPHDGTFDFFLQSHGALEGTARSCHYVVLENGKDWKAFNADELQALTHALCYSYPTATKGVSYAAPAYLADKLCTRGSVFLKGFFDNEKAKLTQLSPKRDDQSIEDYRTYVKGWVEQHGDWVVARNRKNPWHQNMDGTMFYM